MWYVEQELSTLPNTWIKVHPCCSGIRVVRSLVFCVMLCRSLFVLFSFGNCVVCPSTLLLITSLVLSNLSKALKGNHRGHVIIVSRFTSTYATNMHSPPKMNSIPFNGEEILTKHYMIKFYNLLATGSSPYTMVNTTIYKNM